MKKQTRMSAAGRKLNLKKRTISNLTPIEMTNKVGGYFTASCHKSCVCGGGTNNGNTCPGHNTCYTC